MQNTDVQTNAKGLVSFTLVTAIVAVIIAGVYLFFSGYFDVEKNTNKIILDNDNTEIVSEKKDLKEIEDRLSELDIDFDDLLDGLEF